MRIKTLLAASALALGVALAGTASAQTYGRMVSFGDSLSDIGNLHTATGGLQPASPPNFNGRFSNGPVWLELLGFSQVRVGGVLTGGYNSAYGGSRTDNNVLFPPGMRQQITNYLAGGGLFDDDDLVTIWGGANNIFQGMTPASLSPDPFGFINGVSVAAAADMGFMVNQVTTAGAGTVLVPNLPNLGTTPQFIGTAGQGLATQATNTFNAALYSQLMNQAALHPNSNIILMDVHRAFGVVQAAPGRFGFSNITQGCLLIACSTPDSFSYWDTVHPTAAGHRLLASVATDYIYYLDRGAHSALQGEIGVRARADGLDTVTSRLGYGPFAGRAGGIYLGGGYEQTSLDARGVIPGGDLEGMSLVIGAEGNLSDSLRGGIAFQARQGDVSVDLVDFSAEGVSFDAYLGWRSGNIFVNAAAGFSADQYDDILRQTATPGVTASSSTAGETLGAKIEGGVVLDLGGWELSPRAGLAWVSTEVDGYVEENPFGAQHQVAGRSLDTLSAEAVLRLQGEMGPGWGLWGEVGYRDVINHDADDVSVRLAGNPASPLHLEAGDPDGGQTLLGAGLSGHVGIAEVSVGYRGRIGEAYDTHMGVVEVTLSF